MYICGDLPMVEDFVYQYIQSGSQSWVENESSVVRLGPDPEGLSPP